MPSACLGRHDHAVDVAHVQAFAIAVVLPFAPTGTSETCTATSGEPPVCTQVNTSMLSHEGLWVLLPLVLPAIAYLVPVKLRGNLAAWLTAVALLVFCLLTGFTIGLYFVPVALIALVLALRGTGRTRAAQHSPTNAAA
jgi:hypothetical protein